MAPQRREICDCGSLQHMADEPNCPVEFDAGLNEYHIVHQGGGYSMIYYCPFCGGRVPKSRRDRLFQTITDAEQHRLCELTKGMRTVEDVIRAFGEPDVQQSIGMAITTPEKEGQPGTTQAYPGMIYKKLSTIADVYVTLYPNDRVAIRFQGKGVKETKG